MQPPVLNSQKIVKQLVFDNMYRMKPARKIFRELFIASYQITGSIPSTPSDTMKVRKFQDKEDIFSSLNNIQ